MTPLSREQVQKYFEEIDYCFDGYYRSPPGQGGIGDVMRTLYDHDEALRQQVAEMTQKYYEAADERSRIIESDHLYKFVARERDQLAQQVATLKTGTCLKCHMGPLRESCAYPEACEHPGFALALKLNRTLLDLAAMTKERDDLAEGLNLQSFVDVRVEQQCRGIGQQLATAQARYEKLNEHVRGMATGQVDCCKKRERLQATVTRLEGALTEIAEYWNGHENERAMADACHHVVDVATKALAHGAGEEAKL